MVFPFLFVLICIPRSPRRHRPRYEWEFRRRERLHLRSRGWFAPAPPGLGPVPPERRQPAAR